MTYAQNKMKCSGGLAKRELIFDFAWVIMPGLGVGLACVLLLVAFNRVRHGSFEYALAALRGQTLFFAPNRAILVQEDSRFGPHMLTTVQVRNLTAKTIRITGAKLLCTCTVVDDLPMSIDPMSTKSFKIKSTPNKQGVYANLGKVTIYSDNKLALYTSVSLKAPESL